MQKISCAKVLLSHSVIMSWWPRSNMVCILATKPPLFTPQCEVEANWNWFCLSTQTHSFHTKRPGAAAFKHKSSLFFFFFVFLLQHGPYFLISIHLSNRFWPKSHQLLYYGATYILFVWVQLSKEVLKGQWTPHHVLLTHLMQKWSWQVLLEKSKADIDLIVALNCIFFSVFVGQSSWSLKCVWTLTW